MTQPFTARDESHGGARSKARAGAAAVACDTKTIGDQPSSTRPRRRPLYAVRRRAQAIFLLTIAARPSHDNRMDERIADRMRALEAAAATALAFLRATVKGSQNWPWEEMVALDDALLALKRLPQEKL